MVKTKLRLSYRKSMTLYVKTALELLVALICLLISGRGLFLKLGSVVFELGLLCLVSHIQNKSWETYGYVDLFNELNEDKQLNDEPDNLGCMGGILWCGVGAYFLVVEQKQISIAYVIALIVSVLAVAIYGIRALVYGYLDHRDYERYVQAKLTGEPGTDAITDFSDYAVARSRCSLPIRR